jgi:uncharacterized protein (TIGR02246 family)
MRSLLRTALVATLLLVATTRVQPQNGAPRQRDDSSPKRSSSAMPPDSPAVAAARAGLAAGNAEYIRAFGAGDAAGVAAVYAHDGSRMAPKGAVLTGRAAIRADVARFIASVGPVLVTIDSRELWLVGYMAYESGNWSYTFTPPGKPQRRLAGRFVTGWKLQPDGSWRIYADIGLSE